MGAEIFGIDLGFEIPNITTAGFSLAYWITLLMLIILFVAIGGLLIWMYLMKKAYFINIRDFENVSGQGFQLTWKDTARLVKIGDSGEEIILLRKKKQYRTAYGRKMGKNEYWFCKGQDGYWYNVVLGDLDAKMGMLDIEPIDRDMRYMHVAIRKNIQDRYKKVNVMDKYGTYIMSGIFLIIMIIAIWLLMSKAGDLITSAKPTADALVKASEAMTRASATWDSVCSGGSGIS